MIKSLHWQIFWMNKLVLKAKWIQDELELLDTMVFVYEISNLSWIRSYWNISLGLKNLDFAGKRLRRYKTHHIFSWYCRILGVGVKSRERRFVLAALVVWVVALANIVTLCFFGRLLSIMWKLLELRGPLEKWTLKLINYENFQYLYSNHRHNLKFSQWPSFSSKCSWVTDFKLQPPSVHTPARQHLMSVGSLPTVPFLINYFSSSIWWKIKVRSLKNSTMGKSPWSIKKVRLSSCQIIDLWL